MTMNRVLMSLLVIAPVGFIAEQPARAQEPPAPAADTWGGLELALTTGVVTPAVGSSTFRDSGINGTRLHESGAALGYGRPWVWTLGAEALYFPVRYLAVGLYAAGGIGLDGPGPVSPDIAASIDPARLSVIYLGPEIDAVVPLGRVSLRFGSRFGVRLTSIDVKGPNFERCANTNDVECRGSATAADFFLQPDVGVLYKVGDWFVFGVHTGFEVSATDIGDPGLSLGVTVGINATPRFHAR